MQPQLLDEALFERLADNVAAAHDHDVAIGRGGCISSLAMRSFVPHENSGDNAVGTSLVGTMNISRRRR